MIPKKKSHFRSLISILLAVAICISGVPASFAGQQNSYHDPADEWIGTNDNTDEFDVNSVVTTESFYCYECDRTTAFTVFRVPEYTADGTSNSTRTNASGSIVYSDGIYETGYGNTYTYNMSFTNPSKNEDDTNKGYTNHHWTKAVCNTCGIMNSNMATERYGYNNNVYYLYSCTNVTDTSKTLSTTDYTYDVTSGETPKHKKTTDTVIYCGGCYGTHHTLTTDTEYCTLETKIRPELSNGRFVKITSCTKCDYEKTEYIAAKSVVASYFGVVDGQAHTITVSNFCDPGVTAKIEYGTSAGSYGDSIPTYTEEGQYTVYYKITYILDGYTGEENGVMSEEGVAYVWLYDESTFDDDDSCSCGCDDPDCDCQDGNNNSCNGNCSGSCNGNNCNCNGNNCSGNGSCSGNSCNCNGNNCSGNGSCSGNSCSCNGNSCSNGCNGNCNSSDTCSDSHNFKYLDSVEASCLTIGFDRYQCSNCGEIEKRDYVNALGHNYQEVLIREATCETNGRLLKICTRCGDVQVVDTEKGEHVYETYSVEATCLNPGYTVKECTVCGDRHITNITSALAHEYRSIVYSASCESGGFTMHICDGCGSSFTSDYTDALGHSFDSGTKVTDSTCTGEGVTEYRCTRCGYHYVAADDAKGHTPGEAATCTHAQLCTECGAVLAQALDHDYGKEVTEATCTTMGYTTYTCTRCGDSYKSDYTDAKGHTPSDWIIDKEPTTDSEGSKHIECTECGKTLETQSIEKIYTQATTDTYGEATVGGYLVIVTDTDTENPVANATVTLHTDGSISVLLPSGRLLDYNDQTTVTVQLVKDKSAVSNLEMDVTDVNSNYASGTTDKNGQITVPGTTSKSNSDGNATIGYEDENGDLITLTVKVTDYETGRPIEGATVTIKNGKVIVTLPDGTDMDENNRIQIVVTDNKNKPQKDKDVTVKNDLGNIENGKTDGDGKLVVPEVEVTTDITDTNGEATVGGYLVTVTDTDTKNPVANATVTLHTDGSISVLLPSGRLLDYDDQTTVTVQLVKDKSAVSNLEMDVTDVNSNYASGTTDKNGQITVPGTTSKSNSDGNATIGYVDENGDRITLTVKVTDYETGDPIEDATVTINNGKIVVTLPDGTYMDENNRIKIVVTDNKNKPQKDKDVTVKNDLGNIENGKTDKDGKLIVPEVKTPGGGGSSDKPGITDNTTDVTDNHGKATVGGYLVIVTDTDTKNPVSGAKVTLNKDDSISVLLPSGRLLDYDDQTTVTVQLVKNKNVVPDMEVDVTDKKSNYASDTTDKNGQIIVPGTTSDSNDDGKATVGYEDEDGDRITLTVEVIDYETGDPIEGATVTIKNGKIVVTLPDGTDMDEDNRIQIIVTDNKNNPQEDVKVTVKNDDQSLSGTTDEDGELIVPSETEYHSAYIIGYPDGTFGPSRSLTRAEASAIFARLLAAKNGDTIYSSVYSSYSDVSSNSWYSGYVKYLTTYGIAQGYTDGTFRPDDAITRSEFVTMAVRFYSAYGPDDDEDSSSSSISFSDVSSTDWAVEYIREAAENGWVIGYTNGTFGGSSNIIRSEVVTIVNRVLDREADTDYITSNLKKLTTFTDINKGHWAYWMVMEAANAHDAYIDSTDTESWF